MGGEVDEISRIIGQQEATLAGLKESFDRHCDDDDRRHLENLGELKCMNMQLAENNATLKSLCEAFAIMKPVVDGYQITRWKIVGALSLASIILAGLGYGIWQLVTKFAGVIISAILSKP